MTSSMSRRLSSSTKKRLFSVSLLATLVVIQFLPQVSFLSGLQKTFVWEQGGGAGFPVLQAGKNEFDYAAFWKNAMESAQQSLETEAVLATSSESTPPPPCPKVYVYDIPLNKIDDTEKHPRRFGSPVKNLMGKDKLFQGYLHKTNQYAFPSLLEHRLNNSESCRTLDPEQADLFFAPILSAPKGNGGWETSCKRLSGKKVRKQLPHLNSTNACRHFFAIGKGHTDVIHCKGWFSDPIKELKPFARLAYSNYSFLFDEDGDDGSEGKHLGGHRYDPNDTTNVTYPNLFSVPYPSSLHYHSDGPVPHFPDKMKRKALMSFIGKDNHGDTAVRQRIHKLCDRYKDKHVCDYKKLYDLRNDPTPKSRAVFCLEPAGDTPARKSLADSITFGCIPVLFSELTDDVAPWFWLDWKDRARVLVPREDFVVGRIDLKKLLQTIPPELLNLMQTTLKEKSRRFQYSLDDDQEDGVRVILDNLHRQALERESSGDCGY